jgi:hypothetical protein
LVDTELTRPPSAWACSDEVIGAQIKSSFVGSDRTYGARRVWHDVRAEGAAFRLADERQEDSPTRCGCGNTRCQNNQPQPSGEREPTIVI